MGLALLVHPASEGITGFDVFPRHTGVPLTRDEALQALKCGVPTLLELVPAPAVDSLEGLPPFRKERAPLVVAALSINPRAESKAILDVNAWYKGIALAAPISPQKSEATIP